MKDPNIAIELTNVHKDFILPGQRSTSLKSKFTSLFSNASGKPTKQHALNGVSLSVNKGDFFGIVGRNGSGKSTLLKVIAGIYQANKGTAVVRGKLVPFIELGVGFNPELTGRENVYLNGAMLGFSEKEIDVMYEDIVSFAELEKFMDQKLKNYSSGMQVRLAFACATRSQADILLVDEVLAVGDADFQRKCFEYFKHLKRQNKTVVFVTHDMNAVREFCDKAVLIDSGKVAFSGSAADAAREYARLFANPEKYSRLESNFSAKNKWGSGKAEFTSVKVEHNQGFITLKLKVKSNDDIQNPIFGFLVKNAMGVQLFGSSSTVQQKVVPLLKNKTLDISWSFPDVLNDGKHYIDVAITEDDGATIHQWWEDAAVINVQNPLKTPYPINPPIDLKIS